MSLWDEVPDVGALVPDGTYVVDIEDIEKGNVVWKPKAEWPRLVSAMAAAEPMRS